MDDFMDSEVRWDKHHDFHLLHHKHSEPFDVEEIETEKKEMSDSERVLSRRAVDKTTLNCRQKVTHDIIIKASQSRKGESKSHGGRNARVAMILGLIICCFGSIHLNRITAVDPFFSFWQCLC